MRNEVGATPRHDHLKLADLDDAELRALRAYKSAADDENGRSQCSVVNRELEHSLRPEDMGSLGAIVRALDDVFERTPRLAEPTTVSRAVGLRTHMPFAEPGARFRNRAFWSTSSHQDVALNFLKAEHEGAWGALLDMRLPAGLPAYSMATLGGTGGHEMELLLLPRGVLSTVLSSSLIDLTGCVPQHVLRRFHNVAKVTPVADPGWRVPD